MSDITKDQVIDWLSNQSVIEIADLVKELEDKWGVNQRSPCNHWTWIERGKRTS